jgi:sterol desaturase/sphingolipid hydroxylase (fatty acid hydroxylase superfamily)
MHPVESALFFTTMPLFALCGCHPVVILHAQFYNIIQAMIGHESYGAPSTGGHFHWLHHQLIDCNYGGPFVPLDALFGTAVLNVEDFEAKVQGKRA